MKPLQNLEITTHYNTAIQRQPANRLPGAYQIACSDRYVASTKNYLLLKRCFDTVFSALIILFVLSWLLPVIGLLLKLDSKGPVFFKQKRVGLNGKSFMCLKLRTMIINTKADESPACENDLRITKIGSLLRRSNIDELPQFFNVLAGQMSIVGPRPHMTADCIRFSFVISSYAFRHFAKPDITGWAQVKGYHGPAMDYESVINRYYWDAQYVRHSCLWLDAKIIALTIAGSISTLCRYVIKKTKPGNMNSKNQTSDVTLF